MTVFSTTVRSAHLLSNAAWFGGSLAGAVALNPAAREGDTHREQAEIADEGWNRWGPVQGAAVGIHLLSGLGMLVDNRRRTAVHAPTRTAVLLKTALTGAAMAASLVAYQWGADLGDAKEKADTDPTARQEAREIAGRMKWMQWATPATTGALLVLDAYLGEQQRGPAGLLDRATRVVRRS